MHSLLKACVGHLYEPALTNFSNRSGSLKTMHDENACIHRLDLGLYSHPNELDIERKGGWREKGRTHISVHLSTTITCIMGKVHDPSSPTILAAAGRSYPIGEITTNQILTGCSSNQKRATGCGLSRWQVTYATCTFPMA